jgi:hypothetical protein
MKDHKDQKPDDEPVILSFEVHQEAVEHAQEAPPETADESDPETVEAFWAGRNLAMRRSARWAA